jgi:Flp pilus assembly pilin Flp
VKEISRFLQDESGQELMEHAVLWAFIVLVIAIVINGMSSVNLAWGVANTQLSGAAVSTS